MPTVTNPLTLGARKPPTKKHRPAVWENMLGTVYAMNEAKEVRYFDYDYDAALDFAGYGSLSDRDPRTARKTLPYRYTNGASHEEPRKGQMVLWILKEEHVR
jgi:hypothetical protein